MLMVLMTGLAMGSLYAIAGLAFNVMYSTSKVLSVATGHIFMLSGVFGSFFIGTLGVPTWIGFIGAVAVGIAFGVVMELIAVRRIVARSDDHLWLLSTLALGTIVTQIIALWWGTEPRPFPRLFPQDSISGVENQTYWLPILAVLVLMGCLEIFYRKTIFGKVFIAVAEDPFAARARGISTGQVRAASYAIAGLLGGVGGAAAGQLTFANFALGHMLTLSGFIAVAVGGLGSNVGALIGGLVLGLLTAFTSYYFGGEFQQTISVGLLMAFLLFKPEGLLGSQKVRHV